MLPLHLGNGKSPCLFNGAVLESRGPALSAIVSFLTHVSVRLLLGEVVYIDQRGVHFEFHNLHYARSQGCNFFYHTHSDSDKI